jgi:hypothetical protein
LKKIIYLLAFHFFSYISFSQESKLPTTKKEKSYQNWNLNYSLGIAFQKNTCGEVGINFGKFVSLGSCAGGQTILFRATTEFTFIEKKVLFAPKIGIEFSVLPIIIIRTSIANYNNGNFDDKRFINEIGIGGRELSILYGWNVAFDKTKKQDYVSNNRFSLTLNF